MKPRGRPDGVDHPSNTIEDCGLLGGSLKHVVTIMIWTLIGPVQDVVC